MKFAFMSFTCPDATLQEMFDMAKKYGYEGIEPRAQAEHRHGVEITAGSAKRKEIRKMFENSGVECACIATSLKYCFTDKAKRQEYIDTTRQFIDLAHDIGCKRLRVFGGNPDKEITAAEGIEIVGEALQGIKKDAEEKQVYVCLETHDFFSRADVAAPAVRIAESPYIRINWDIMHPYTRNMTIEEAFAEVKDLVAHCHIHDGTYDKDRRPKLALMGQGEIPYNIAVRLLQNMGYEGYLSGEYISAWPPDVVLPNDIDALRSYLV
ncbi:MAG TPA: sugar phosphate isomerase/epimerase family protein [bacterium]|nr:sugar phosphate isomerase/epimerase family protein [bacterium]